MKSVLQEVSEVRDSVAKTLGPIAQGFEAEKDWNGSERRSLIICIDKLVEEVKWLRRQVDTDFILQEESKLRQGVEVLIEKLTVEAGHGSHTVSGKLATRVLEKVIGELRSLLGFELMPEISLPFDQKEFKG